jgi:hypothetical protein
MKPNKTVHAAAVASLVFASLAVTSSAHANQASETSDKGGTASIQTVNKECEASIKVAALRSREKMSVDVCKVQVTTSYSDARAMTLADVWNAKDSLSDSDFDSLARAVTAGAVKSRAYSQQMNHITDSETQSGIFYYDGARAWVTSSYRGSTGSHRCMIDWAVGFGVSPQNCYETGTLSERALSQQWLMTPVLNGFPVSWSETYTVRVNAAGQVW